MVRISTGQPWRYATNTALSQAEQGEVTALCNAGFTGKWMPFTSPDRVGPVWAQIVEATEAGRLGWAAKVDNQPPRPGRDLLICVYTKDHRDTQDLTRVLAELREMGIDQRLSYKEDAATMALRYGGGAALYVAQPGTTYFDRRRAPYGRDDQNALFGEPDEQEELTVEQMFRRKEPYGPFPPAP
ncbi:putative phosphothreonine lyase domain-containing protein [Spirillospora sp. NBC_01491]|uniref:putative phosphothreonine lyase domain-containing protein n=1 Tax=Spirillospora sp. NBC_01491 TaxID=2976007 RepID=UPI002E37FF97|nr:putative phosphothreonine lyase domain-containg protein [Spirillospora sp. NBC_01491]